MTAAGMVAPQMGEMFKGFGMERPVENITCPNCNKEVPKGSKFCLECGTKIEIIAENEVICPVCGKKTTKAKFCMECGASLVVKCEKCGAEVPNGAKFCLQCGEKI
jgi:predicted amidophosphoribosyltransferase